jgi:molybdopterin synthase sulfur carrier subunit
LSKPRVPGKGKIRLELLPWVSETCGFKRPGRLILEEEVEEGATTGALLRNLAAEHPALAEAIFDPSGERFSGSIGIVLNGRLLGLHEGLETAVRDGDTVTLFPFIDGG